MLKILKKVLALWDRYLNALGRFLGSPRNHSRPQKQLPPGTYISGLLYSEMKTDRAALHLAQLTKLCDAFSEDPYTVTERDDVERGLYVFRVELNRMTPEVPVLVGEFAYNLRSALDHLAWQLALLSGLEPTHSVAFPIYSDKGLTSTRQFKRDTRNIPAEAIEIMFGLQPHRRKKTLKSHPLWQLNKLCNLDKHRTIAFSHTVVNVRTGPKGSKAPLRYRDTDQAVELAVPLSFKHEVKFEPIPPHLIFGKPMDAPGADFTLTLKDIAEIHRFVRKDVLPQFARFFG